MKADRNRQNLLYFVLVLMPEACRNARLAESRTELRVIYGIRPEKENGCAIRAEPLQKSRHYVIHHVSVFVSMRIRMLEECPFDLFFCFPIEKQCPYSHPYRGNNKKVANIATFLFWCGRWDLNPYARAHAPQTCLSANSSTAAHLYSIRAQGKFVNIFFKICTFLFRASSHRAIHESFHRPVGQRFPLPARFLPCNARNSRRSHPCCDTVQTARGLPYACAERAASDDPAAQALHTLLRSAASSSARGR